jgi:MFS family permease
MCVQLERRESLVRIHTSDSIRRIYKLSSATNILGPLKSRLQREMGASNAQFGLLLSAYTLNGTWTPLIGGILASRLGTTLTSILATGVILLGAFPKQKKPDYLLAPAN